MRNYYTKNRGLNVIIIIMQVGKKYIIVVGTIFCEIL